MEPECLAGGEEGRRGGREDGRTGGMGGREDGRTGGQESTLGKGLLFSSGFQMVSDGTETSSSQNPVLHGGKWSPVGFSCTQAFRGHLGL